MMSQIPAGNCALSPSSADKQDGEGRHQHLAVNILQLNGDVKHRLISSDGPGGKME